AHHRPGRRGPARDPPGGAAAAQGARLRGRVHHPRPADAAGDLRPDRRDEGGADRRDRDRREPLLRAEGPLHPAPAGLLPLPDRGGRGLRARRLRRGPARRTALRPGGHRMTTLTVTDLHKSYRLRSGARFSTLQAVKGVDLELRPGRTVALVGQSGSGKSTIAKILAQLEKRTSGTITLAGEIGR